MSMIENIKLEKVELEPNIIATRITDTRPQKWSSEVKIPALINEPHTFTFVNKEGFDSFRNSVLTKPSPPCEISVFGPDGQYRKQIYQPSKKNGNSNCSFDDPINFISDINLPETNEIIYLVFSKMPSGYSGIHLEITLKSVIQQTWDIFVEKNQSKLKKVMILIPSKHKKDEKAFWSIFNQIVKDINKDTYDNIGELAEQSFGYCINPQIINEKLHGNFEFLSKTGKTILQTNSSGLILKRRNDFYLDSTEFKKEVWIISNKFKKIYLNETETKSEDIPIIKVTSNFMENLSRFKEHNDLSETLTMIKNSEEKMEYIKTLPCKFLMDEFNQFQKDNETEDFNKLYQEFERFYQNLKKEIYQIINSNSEIQKMRVPPIPIRQSSSSFLPVSRFSSVPYFQNNATFE